MAENLRLYTVFLWNFFGTRFFDVILVVCPVIFRDSWGSSFVPVSIRGCATAIFLFSYTPEMTSADLDKVLIWIKHCSQYVTNLTKYGGKQLRRFLLFCEIFSAFIFRRNSCGMPGHIMRVLRLNFLYLWVLEGALLSHLCPITCQPQRLMIWGKHCLH